MAYTGNTVFLNRRMLISDPNGSIFYQGSTWSQYGVPEPNMDIYGNPILGNYLDVNGNELYFPAVATTSCVNICYQYYPTNTSPISYIDCDGNSIEFETHIGNVFCGIEVISGTYSNIGLCSDSATNTTTLDYNWQQDYDYYDDGVIMVTDITLGLVLLNLAGPASGTINVINGHTIRTNVDIGLINTLTDLVIISDVTMINNIGKTSSQTYDFVVDSSVSYSLTADSYYNGTTLNYDTTGLSSLSPLVITDKTSNIELLNTTYPDTGTLTIIDKHLIKIEIILTGLDNYTSLEVDDGDFFLPIYNNQLYAGSQSFTFSCDYTKGYSTSAGSGNNV